MAPNHDEVEQLPTLPDAIVRAYNGHGQVTPYHILYGGEPVILRTGYTGANSNSLLIRWDGQNPDPNKRNYYGLRVFHCQYNLTMNRFEIDPDLPFVASAVYTRWVYRDDGWCSSIKGSGVMLDYQVDEDADDGASCADD